MDASQSDEALLESFAASRDEQAFRTLARRYSGLIFHTAIRTVEDRALAEDVGQRVLLALAKKAAQIARGKAPLVAWLHNATVLEARLVRRTELRHQRKKQGLMKESSDMADTGEALWKEALPHLDTAIDHLSDTDRDVILLHFVNELTFPEIARRLGKSAAAVQKQSRRALEKLHSSLSRKGVSLSVGLLTTCLATEMSKASPVLLAPALGSLSSLGKTTTTFAMKKSTIAAVASTALLCGVPLAQQQISINRLESQASNGFRSSEQVQVSSRPSGVATSTSILKRLGRDLKAENYDLPRYLGANDYVQSVGNDELIGLIRETIASDMAAEDRTAVFLEISNVLGKRDPEIVLNLLRNIVPQDYIIKNKLEHLLPSHLRNLSEKDAPRALEWFTNQLEFIRSLGASDSKHQEQLEHEIRVALAYGLIMTAPSDAAEILRPLPDYQIQSSFQQIVSSIEPSLRKDASGYIQTVRELLPEQEANEALGYLVGINHGDGKLKSADILLQKYDFSPSETEAIFLNLGRWHFGNASNKRDGLNQAIPEYREWLRARVTEGIDLRVGKALGRTVNSYGNSSDPIYEAMLKSAELGLSDDAIRGFLETVKHRLGEEKSNVLKNLLSDHRTVEETLPEAQNQ